MTNGIAQAGQLLLSDEQRSYLDNRGPITMCVDPDWLPYEKIDVNGKHIGIAADYMNLFSKMIAKKIKLVPTSSWPQSEKYAAERKCDILSMLNKTKERSKYLNFTDPYIETSAVLVAHNDVAYLDGLKSLVGKTLGMVKNYFYEGIIRERYPEIKIVYVNSMDEAYEKVSKKEIFATIGSLFVVTNRIQELGLSNLKIAGPAEYKNYFRVGIRNDDPVLLEIFKSAVNQIDPKVENEILRRWVSVRFEHGTDYTLLGQVTTVSLIIFFLLLYRNRSVKQVVVKLNKMNSLLNEKTEELHRLSRTDTLTALFNRLHLDEKLEEEVHRFSRYRTPCSVILLDIDHFKKINDKSGHAIGDSILKQVSLKLLNNVRINDIVGRWGGEEFLVICPEITAEDAMDVAEKLRLTIEQGSYEEENLITCSFGVAEISKNDSASSLVSRADKALYQSKHTGRNCVTLYQQK